MIARGVVVVASHDPWLVALSVAISIVAAYAAHDLAQRIRDARGREWLIWLFGRSVTDAVGTWSMHFTGMLALRLPVPLEFDGPMVLLSLLVGIVGAVAARLMVGRGPLQWPRAILGAICLGGIGMSGLRYTAMAGLRLPRIEHHYGSRALLVVSVAAAIAIVLLALALRMHEAEGARGLRRHATTILRGLANPVMHYTAMAAVVFTYTGRTYDEADSIKLASLGVTGVSVLPVMIVVIALLAAYGDRLRKQQALLDELFEEAPHPIALLSREGTVVRVNNPFTAVFGYGAEAAGQNVLDLIVPPEDRAPARDELLRAVRTGMRVENESVRWRKDGTPVPVAVAVVPVVAAADGVDVCAMYIDISERKAAEEAQRTFPRRLIETQESERKHIARELHDEIGQVLTSAVMMLTLSAQLRPDEARTRVEESKALLDDLVDKVRGLALDLRPSVLDHFGLAAALAGFFQRFTAQTGVRIAFRDFVTDGQRFGSEIETAAYRIVQEALTNVARHARASEATVTLLAEDEVLRVEVEDRGAGFDADGRAQQSFGLSGMRERANILGGRFLIHSSAGAGTRVVAELPLRAA